MSVLISSGEASGDALAGALIGELKAAGYEGALYAVGGARTEAAGATLVADSRTWAALGVYESAKAAGKIYVRAKGVQNWMANHRPQLVIAIDFGFFNVWLLRKAKAFVAKTLYFMPPGSWRRDKQGKDLPNVADRIATPFEWSERLLREMGADAEWVGHPVVQLTKGLAQAQRDRIAVLPGSRSHEIEANTPAMAQAIELAHPRLPVDVPVAPGASDDRIREIWHGNTNMPLLTSHEGAAHTLGRSHAAIICSGTATLEAAVVGTPMVVIYRLNKIMALEGRIRKPKFDFIALPNIIAGRRIVPELIHDAATPENIAAELRTLMEDSPERSGQLADFEAVLRQLGPDDAVTRAARIALDMLAR